MLRAPRITAALTAAAALFGPGCAESSNYENLPRPPAEITVGASINRHAISVSPQSFGAGPINLTIVNQTDRSQRVVLESRNGPSAEEPGTRQATGPINPRDSATISADVDTGMYVVRVANDGIAPAKLDVGEQRPSSQQDLLLP